MYQKNNKSLPEIFRLWITLSFSLYCFKTFHKALAKLCIIWWFLSPFPESAQPDFEGAQPLMSTLQIPGSSKKKYACHIFSIENKKIR